MDMDGGHAVSVHPSDTDRNDTMPLYAAVTRFDRRHLSILSELRWQATDVESERVLPDLSVCRGGWEKPQVQVVFVSCRSIRSRICPKAAHR